MMHWRLYKILKANNQRVWSIFFLYLKVYIFWKFIQYTIHWDKTQILRKFSSDKTNLTKNALFFISWTPTHDSFTFNSQFLEGIYTWNFILGWNHPCLWWNASYCLHVLQRWNFIPRWKKEKKTCKHFILGWNFKMSMFFFFFFLRYVLKYAFQKLTCLNILRVSM